MTAANQHSIQSNILASNSNERTLNSSCMYTAILMQHLAAQLGKLIACMGTQYRSMAACTAGD